MARQKVVEHRAVASTLATTIPHHVTACITPASEEHDDADEKYIECAEEHE